MNTGCDMIFAVPTICPWCAEDGELLIEHDVEGEMVVDCEVCCRPWRVLVTYDKEGVHADVDRG